MKRLILTVIVLWIAWIIFGWETAVIGSLAVIISSLDQLLIENTK